MWGLCLGGCLGSIKLNLSLEYSLAFKSMQYFVSNSYILLNAFPVFEEGGNINEVLMNSD